MRIEPHHNLRADQQQCNSVDQMAACCVTTATLSARVEASMTIYRLVSHFDGLWLEGFNDQDEEWEIVDGPFDSRYEGACALRRCRERQEHREIRAA
jgi:hypothetical protein